MQKEQGVKGEAQVREDRLQERVKERLRKRKKRRNNRKGVEKREGRKGRLSKKKKDRREGVKRNANKDRMMAIITKFQMLDWFVKQFSLSFYFFLFLMFTQI